MAGVVKRKDPKTGRILPKGVSYRHCDGRYIYRYSYNGKYHYEYGHSLDEIKEKIKKRQVDVITGKNIEVMSLKLNDWWPQYLDRYKKSKIKISSYQNKFNYYNWYIKDSDLGVTRLEDITKSKVVAHLQWLADNKKLARGTISTINSMLYCCMKEVLSDGGLQRVNPFEDIMENIKTKPKKEVEALTIEEQKALLGYLQKEGFQNTYLPLLGIMLTTGMRYGEITCLTWDDVDFENNMIYINKTMNYRELEGSRRFYITTPKTVNATRDLVMSKETRYLFQMQKEYQQMMRIRQDVEIPMLDEDGKTIKIYKGFIMTTKLGFPITNEGIRNSIGRIIKNYNIEENEIAKQENRKALLLKSFSPHVLRHTYCTRLIERMMETNSVSYEQIMYLMGHAKIQTSIDIYTSISDKIKKKAGNTIEGLIEGFEGFDSN